LGAVRPVVQVGLPSDFVGQAGGWYGQVAGSLLTRILTTDLDDYGRVWNP
jgi:hypothetical protein